MVAMEATLRVVSMEGRMHNRRMITARTIQYVLTVKAENHGENREMHKQKVVTIRTI